MMLAASLAGIGFGAAGVHIPHACAYPIAGLKHEYRRPAIPPTTRSSRTGMSVIVTAPAAFRFTYEADRSATTRSRRCYGSNRRRPDALPDALSDADARRRRAEGITELGYEEDDISALVEGALSSSACSSSPRARPARTSWPRSCAHRSELTAATRG